MSSGNIKNRIKLLRETLKLSQKDFGNRLNIRDTAVSKYELGAVKPSFEILSKIGKTFAVNLNWLINNEGQIFLHQPEIDKKCEFIYIPEFGDPVSAGQGAIMNSEGIECYHCFPRHFIYNDLLATPEDLFMLKVMGDSMEPIINDNDIIMIDRSSISIREGKVYLCVYYNELLIKKIQVIGDGKYSLISENKLLYPPIEAIKSKVTIIGRVIWFGRKI